MAASDSAASARTEKREAFRRARAAKNREVARERRRKARLEEVNARIAELEARLTELRQGLADPPCDRSEVQRMGEEYMEAERELETLLEEWDQLRLGG